MYLQKHSSPRSSDDVKVDVASGSKTPPVPAGPALWFRLHEPVQWVGVLLVVAALVVILVDAGALTAAKIAASPTSGAHQIVGILAVTLTVSQPVFAFCRNGCSSREAGADANAAAAAAASCHARWHVLHAAVGLLSLLLALAALPLGQLELSSGTLNIYFLVGWLLLLFSLLAAVVAANAARCLDKAKLSNSSGFNNGSQSRPRTTISNSKEQQVAAVAGGGGVGADCEDACRAAAPAAAAAAAAAAAVAATDAASPPRCPGLPYFLLAAQALACVLCVAGVVAAGILGTGTAGGSAAVTDEVRGDYNFCTYMPGYVFYSMRSSAVCLLALSIVRLRPHQG
jgi:hypothetical protein